MKWSEKECELLLSYAIASDEERKSDRDEYVRHMMYFEGSHPDFKIRSQAAVARKIRQLTRKSLLKNL